MYINERVLLNVARQFFPYKLLFFRLNILIYSKYYYSISSRDKKKVQVKIA